MTDAERSVIASLIISTTSYKQIADDLYADDFQTDFGKAVWNACIQLTAEGTPIDVVTVLSKVGNTPDNKEALVRMAEFLPNAYAVRSYAEILKAESRRRKAQNMVMLMQEELFSGASIEVIQRYADELCKALTDSPSGDEMSAMEAWESFVKEQQQPKPDYIKTGFSMLDEKTYIEKGDYIIIGARPSTGKTAFALNLMANMSKARNCVFFSLETKNEKLRDRAMASIFHLNFGKIKHHSLTEEEQAPIGAGFSEYRNKKFTFVKAAGKSVSWMQAKALKLGAEIVFIDYIGLINAEGNSRYEKVTNVSIDLHTFAQQTGTTVIALSQLNRGGSDIPTMKDLRESGQIEQDADLIILLHNGNQFEVIVAKNKEGVTGAVPFQFIGDQQRFVEVTTRYDAPRDRRKEWNS